ncbi:MAG: hypothetical protein SFY95_12015 [Planctomycetota bacterium]|nr:hypothetical protein [Planctomycetota bacterium]
MKSAWTIVSVIALANVLALGAFIGWLHSSGRLNTERARAVREIFTATIAEEDAKKKEEEAKAEAAKKAAEEAAKLEKPPMTAAEQLAARLDASEVDRQRMERLRREVADLQSSLVREREKLSQEQSAFRAEVAAWHAQREQLEAKTKTEQFRRAVALLGSLKSGEATTLLREIIRTGDAPAAQASAPAPTSDTIAANTPSAELAQAPANPAPAASPGLEQAVIYLNALDDRPRSKIMTELAKSDPALAADLLERLRTLGTFAAGPQAAAP